MTSLFSDADADIDQVTHAERGRANLQEKRPRVPLGGEAVILRDLLRARGDGDAYQQLAIQTFDQLDVRGAAFLGIAMMEFPICPHYEKFNVKAHRKSSSIPSSWLCTC